MPCRSYDDERDSSPSQRELLDKLARIACKALTHTEQSGDGLEILILKDPEVADWWRQHKEDDRRAREGREREERKKKLRKSALEKLSPEERKILGL